MSVVFQSLRVAFVALAILAVSGVLPGAAPAFAAGAASVGRDVAAQDHDSMAASDDCCDDDADDGCPSESGCDCPPFCHACMCGAYYPPMVLLTRVTLHVPLATARDYASVDLHPTDPPSLDVFHPPRLLG